MMLINALNIGAGLFGIGKGIYNLIQRRKKNKEEKEEKEEQRRRTNEALNRRLREIDDTKRDIERRNRDYEQQIYELQQQLRNNIEEERRRQFEREKQLLEKERQEREEKLRQMEKEKEAIEKCKASLDNEFTESMLEIFNKFEEEQERWINTLDEPEIKVKICNLKEELNLLFDKLFEYENIMQKINIKFLKIVKSKVNQKELQKMNFIVIGTSGVGKSTLINEILGEKVAKEGLGTRCTLENQKYESKLVPFVSLLDTMGTEIGKGHELEVVEKETLEEIVKKLDNNDPNEHIHCIIYCTTSNRFFEDELKMILEIRKKYDGKKLPIVIVYTKANDEEAVESSKNTINEFLKKYEESLSNDIFGITFIPVYAREERIKNMGLELYNPCFGLHNLMSTCFKKGEQSYRFAIKNSLVQIGKNSIKEYIDIMHSKLVNNIDYFHYLYQQFDPNFMNYIAFCFEKITDIDKQKGIRKRELNKLQKYLSDNQVFVVDQELSTVKCMICEQIPKNPLKCKFCNSEVCKNCYLSKDDYECSNCYQSVFVDGENKEYGTENKEKNNDDYYNEDKDNYNEIVEKNNISKNKCMICSKDPPEEPYECQNCKYKICENCFLKQYEDEDFKQYYCDNCQGIDFEKAQEEKKVNLDFVPGDSEELRKLEENNNIKELSKDKCMICSEKPEDPYVCKICGFKTCEKCFLKQYQKEDFEQYHCDNCDGVDFDKEMAQNEIKEEKPKKVIMKKVINVIVDEDDNENANVDNYNEIVEKKNISKNKCMICSKDPPEEPYECQNCKYKICENCFLKQYEDEDFKQYYCDNCQGIDFEKAQEEKKVNLDFLPGDSEKLRKPEEKEEETEEEKEEEDNDIDDNDNYSILTNKLNVESRNEIGNYIKKFRNELMEVLNDKFNEFAEKSANEVYLKVLEKYIEINKEENVKLDKMDNKEILKAKAVKEINAALKEKAIENFLSKISSQFFQDIVTKFKERCEQKLNTFINNLLNNEEANEFFKNCDEINGKKKLTFEKEKNEYLENLLKKETASYAKSAKYQDILKGNKGSKGCASDSSCPSESNCESSQPNNSESNGC